MTLLDQDRKRIKALKRKVHRGDRYLFSPPDAREYGCPYCGAAGAPKRPARGGVKTGFPYDCRTHTGGSLSGFGVHSERVHNRNRHRDQIVNEGIAAKEELSSLLARTTTAPTEKSTPASWRRKLSSR